METPTQKPTVNPEIGLGISQILVINKIRVLGSRPPTPPNFSGSTPPGSSTLRAIPYDTDRIHLQEISELLLACLFHCQFCALGGFQQAVDSPEGAVPRVTHLKHSA